MHQSDAKSNVVSEYEVLSTRMLRYKERNGILENILIPPIQRKFGRNSLALPLRVYAVQLSEGSREDTLGNLATYPRITKNIWYTIEESHSKGFFCKTI